MIGYSHSCECRGATMLSPKGLCFALKRSVKRIYMPLREREIYLDQVLVHSMLYDIMCITRRVIHHKVVVNDHTDSILSV